jgi:hypothetical protein
LEAIFNKFFTFSEPQKRGPKKTNSASSQAQTVSSTTQVPYVWPEPPSTPKKSTPKSSKISKNSSLDAQSAAEVPVRTLDAVDATPVSSKSTSASKRKGGEGQTPSLQPTKGRKKNA